jgi:6-phosphogluconolactonase/glucosamine-6-phosphate isomerase/deaminase
MAEVVIVGDDVEAGELAAGAIVDLVRQRPDAVLGLATGSTPLSTYRALARRIDAERLDVSRVRGFALDEYVGLPSGHPEGYRQVIAREVAALSRAGARNSQPGNGRNGTWLPVTRLIVANTSTKDASAPESK